MIYILIFILYLVAGISNFALLNSVEVKFPEALDNIWINKRWKRIILRLTWIFLWPMYFACYMLQLGWCGTINFIKEIIK